METYELSLDDINLNYFHFTKRTNIKSIAKSGLLPKILFHAQSLEVTKKVFFVEGLDNLLILFDCWINISEKYPLIPGVFNLGNKLKGKNMLSRLVINVYLKWTEINKLHRFFAYKWFDYFLKKYTLLNINIKEGLDFSYDDVDEIKAKGYAKEYLIKYGYSLKYSDLESTKMDRWNLHTFSNHGVAPENIKICTINNSYNMNDILNFAIYNTRIDIKEICPVLYKYLKKRNYL